MNAVQTDLIKFYGYSFVVEQISENDLPGYNLYIPALGRYTCRAFGYSYEEAYSNLNTILDFIIEEYKKKGISIPKEQVNDGNDREFSGKLILRIPKGTHKRLYLNAKSNNISLNQYLLSIIERNNTLEEVENLIKRNDIDNSYDRSNKSYSQESSSNYKQKANYRPI